MKKRNFLAVLASCAVLASMFPVTANAANTYTAVTGSTTAFDKYLVMDENANVPNVSFEYTVTAGTAQSFDAGNQTIAVYAGPTPEKITFKGDVVEDTVTDDQKFEIAFAQGDDVQATAAETDYVKNLDAGEKYAKKTATLDFSAVEFDEPGIYRYIITETNNGAQAVVYDADLTRVLDVYVENDEVNGDVLKVSKYILHATDETVTVDNTTYGSDGSVISGATTQTEGVDTSDYKSQGFTNEYTTHVLTFGKEVKGNQGSKDKYFAFTLKIEDAVAGTKYNVVLDKADAKSGTTSATKAEYQDKNNVSEIVVPAGETGVTTTFYLQDGQYITVQGLAKDTKYTLSEDSEDYASAEKIAETDSTFDKNGDGEYDELIDAVSGIVESADIYTGFTNTREGVIPTGVILSVAAPVVIGLAVLGGIVFLFIRNKKRDAEEE